MIISGNTVLPCQMVGFFPLRHALYHYFHTFQLCFVHHDSSKSSVSMHAILTFRILVPTSRFIPHDTWISVGFELYSKHLAWLCCVVFVVVTERDATNVDSNLRYQTVSDAQSRASSWDNHRLFVTGITTMTVSRILVPLWRRFPCVSNSHVIASLGLHTIPRIFPAFGPLAGSPDPRVLSHRSGPLSHRRPLLVSPTQSSKWKFVR